MRSAVFVLGIAMVLGPSAQDLRAESWMPQTLAEWKTGLDMVHQGRHEEGLGWVLARQGERSDDICGDYFAALLYLEYELGGSDEVQSKELGMQHLERGLNRKYADDVGSRFCRGALRGLRSSQRVQDGSYVGAAFDGKKMRRIMLDLMDEYPSCVDCKFWLGVYDYYAAVLPRYIKFFRTFLFLPKGDAVRGIAELEEASRRGTFDRYNAHWVLSGIYQEEENPDARRDVLQRLTAAYPDDVDAASALARNYSQVEPRDPDGGTAIMERLIARLEGIEDDYARRRLVDARYDLGRLYSRSYRTEDAVPEFREALLLASGDQRQELRVGEGLIRTLNVTGRHAEAVNLFGELERRYPEADLRTLRREAGAFDAETSREMRELLPARRLAWNDEIDEAEALYKRLLAEHGGSPQIHFWLAELYFGKQRWTESEARFKRVAEQAPDMPTYAVPFTQLRLGQIADTTDRRGEAKDYYRRARDDAGDYDRFRSAAEHFLKNRYSGD
jgi:tetratricopeptide (TPR) repeat protein